MNQFVNVYVRIYNDLWSIWKNNVETKLTLVKSDYINNNINENQKYL